MRRGISTLLLLLALFMAPAAGETIDVCPAGCAQVSVQAAIDAASPHDTVFVHEGTYTEHLNIGKPLTLKGEGVRTVILSYRGGTDLFVNGSGVEVESIAFSGEGYGIYAVAVDSLHIRNCTFMNQSSGVQLRGVSNGQLEGNSFFGIRGAAIWLEQSQSATIRGSYFEGCSEGIGASHSADLFVEGNTFRRCQSGIAAGDSPRARIGANLFESCEHGIVLRNSLDSRIFGDMFNHTVQPISLLDSPAAIIDTQETSLPIQLMRSGGSMLTLGRWRIGCGDCRVEPTTIGAPEGARMMGNALSMTTPEVAGEVLVSAQVLPGELEGLDLETVGIHVIENGSSILIPQDLQRGENLTFTASFGNSGRKHVLAILGRPKWEFPVLLGAILVIAVVAAAILLIRRRG
ncbi:MAG: NosD domain-containing protein [Methanomicrobiales archaeon]|nr:NosD domain-containing protein [Methanomicrobiales archaeon]